MERRRDIARFVTLGDTGYKLKTWYLGIEGLHTRLGYEFTGPDNSVIFTGTDFRVPGCYDTDDTLRCLIGFFLVGPDDVDPDYFRDYTPAGTAFRDGPDREDLWGYGRMAGDWEGSDGSIDDWPLVDVPYEQWEA